MEQRDVVVDAVKQGHITRLLGLYEDMGSRGLQWEEVPPDEIADRRALLATVPGRLSVPHLRQILLAWDQWVKGKPSRADLYAPSPTHLGLFLQKESHRGPTVAASRMRGYRWLNTNLGLPFPVTAAVVRDFAHAKAAHVPNRAQTLSPGDFINILTEGLREEGCSSIPAKLTILACIACIRCKHFARSRLQRHTSEVITAFCTKGKKVSKGSHPPYSWALPILPIMG